MLTGKWLKRVLGAGVFLGMVWLNAVLWAGPNDGLTFYASFNQGLKADVSAGNGQADGLKANLVDGHYEKGVRVDRGGYLNYAMTDNLNLKAPAGSIAVWVCMDRDTTDTMVAGSSGARYINHLLIVDYADTGNRFNISMDYNQIYFQTYDAVRKSPAGANAVISYYRLNWKAGDWHQIVITWQQKANGYYDAKLYTDGKPNYKLDQEYNLAFATADPGVLKIGYYARTEATNYYSYYFQGVIDELRIYKRCLPPVEIKEMFAAGI